MSYPKNILDILRLVLYEFNLIVFFFKQKLGSYLFQHFKVTKVFLERYRKFMLPVPYNNPSTFEMLQN